MNGKVLEPISTEKLPNMKHSLIRKQFPVGDRMALALNCCKKSDMYADYINSIDPQFEFKDEFKQVFQ